MCFECLVGSFELLNLELGGVIGMLYLPQLFDKLRLFSLESVEPLLDGHMV